MGYSELIKVENYDYRLLMYMSGEIEHPSSFVTQGQEVPIILPALIPIWCDQTDTVGLWKHWFTNSRYPTIVIQSPENCYRVQEIALNLDQLIASESYSLISAEGDVADDISSFCAPVESINVNEIVRLYKKYDHDPKRLSELDIFKDNVPMFISEMEYKGNFPKYSSDISSSELRNSCTVEYSKDVVDEISELDISPEWFKVKDQEPLFYKLLLKEDFSGAWMCLNSNGWMFEDAKKAMKKLANKVNDKNFSILTEAWTNLSLEINGGY
ncbi:hypothetical protein WH50_24865 [Pokkaliibacter plantistimulans]|uniref:DUF4123 domain-containing protein n=1 Tax=Pokkaliibacter plantistimulans TaxID=1635171 RepID=A0ABX5LTU5_9GAMM|nr:hypothetical protein [Pokkaliibacter plantistimulans]PXF28701.1 hypothetical protein WH50_24865 [Pokkaliibacter plantistimulans]